MEFRSAEIELIDIKRMQRLREAALEGSINSLHELLRQDELILHRASVVCAAETALHIASVLGHLDFARELLRCKTDLATQPDIRRRQTPLHLASANGHLHLVRELLFINPDVCLAQDRDGNTPLHLAAVQGQVEVVKELLRLRPQATRALVDCRQTILHLCVKHDRLEALKLLVNSTGDHEFVNSKDDDGNTILHLAAADRQIDTIRYLLSETAIKVNVLNVNSFTALDVLTRSPRDMRDMEIEEVLRGSGALRAREIPPAARNGNDIIWANHHLPFLQADEHDRQAPAHGQPAASRTGTTTTHFRNQQKRVKKVEQALIVVAILIATIAFQVGVNPPGGVWQDNSQKFDASAGIIAPPPQPDYQYNAGKSILAYGPNPRKEFRRLYRCNTTGFIASLSVILLILSGLPLKSRIYMWVMIVTMWVAITAMVLTYLFSIIALTPTGKHDLDRQLKVAVITWLTLMTLLILSHGIQLIFTWMKSWGMWRSRRGGNHGNRV